MASKLESKDIYQKLNDLYRNFAENDNVLKEKLEKFLKDNPMQLKEEEQRKQ
jgi:hypothetical protein